MRYSELDLTDANIVGGEMSDWTFGVNWHLHAHARIMLNYIRSSVDTPTDRDLNIFAMRFASGTSDSSAS